MCVFLINSIPLYMRRILYTFFALALIFSSAPAVNAAALTETQIQAILGMISAFGADSTTLSNVNASLRGQPTQTTASSATPTALSPVITSISPATASVGQTTTFTISGTNFANAIVHYTNYTTGNSGTITPSSLSATSISFSATPSTAGSVSFYLKTASGHVSEIKTVTIGTTASQANKSITITYPNGGEWLVRSSSKDVDFRVKWNSSNLNGMATAYLWSEPLGGTTCLLGTAPVSRGEILVAISKDDCPFQIGTTPSDQFKILLTTDTPNPQDRNDERGVYDRSDNFFTLSFPTTSASATTQSTSTSAPVITSLNHTSATVGTALTFIISGSNFKTGATVQYMNSATGSSGTITSATVLSTGITFSATPSAAGIITFWVKNPDGQISGSRQITVLGSATAPATTVTTPTTALSISALTPSLVRGSTATFTITGSGFTSGATVKYSGNSLGNYNATFAVSYLSTTQLSVTATNLIPSTYTLFVRNPDGNTTGTKSFTVTSASPVITSFSPTSIAAGTNANLIITGSGFKPGAVVVYSGPATGELPASYVSGTGDQVSVGPYVLNTAGTYTFYVKNPDGGTSGVSSPVTVTSSTVNTSSTTVIPSPTVSSLSPSSFRAGQSGITVHMLGTGFQSGAQVVITNDPSGKSYTILPTFHSSTDLSIVTGTLDEGTYYFYVKNPDGKTSVISSIVVGPPLSASVFDAFRRVFDIF